ncbi:MAG TPA: serine hydrolase domain-containing protein [Steroidobacteraceae bacterium]|nr:serine hydrolase domain-containing protein [Steroidobacteraceae bacterium]
MGRIRALPTLAAALFAGLCGALAVADEKPAAAPAAAAVAAPVALTAEDVNAWLDGYMPYALKTGDIAGAVVAVVKDGQILTERGFGYADVAAKKPVDPKLTLFRPGSVSKLFTWTAVMQMVEQGKLNLDADVNTYLDFKIPARDGQPITMRNLMQHTAGFEEQAKDIIAEVPATTPSYDQLLKVWTPHRVFKEGSTPAYSNYGASLAGYIVQRLSGEPFNDYIKRHIFDPLDMQHSTFAQPLPPDLAPLMSKGYPTASSEPRPFEIIGPAPAGSLSSPGEDMAHFMIAQLQNGEYHGKRILNADTAATMHDSPLTLLPPLNRMELGFFETNINGLEVIGHLGDTDYFHTSLHLLMKENVGFYVSFNSLGKEGAAGTLRVALFQDFADRYFPAPRPLARVDAKASAEHAALMSGNWVNSRGSQSNFFAALGFLGQAALGADGKGELVTPLTDLSGKPRHWVETAPFVWVDVNGHDRLAAKVVDGQVVRWSFDELSPFMVFDRVPWYQNAAWLRPLLSVSVAALLLTVLLWPVSALVRRSFRAPLLLDPVSLRAYRLSKIAAVAILGGLLLWCVIFALMLKDTNNLSSRLDWLLWLAEIFGTIAFIGGTALMLWNLKTVWQGARRWPAKVWSVVLSVSALGVLWAAFAFKLISFGTHY